MTRVSPAIVVRPWRKPRAPQAGPSRQALWHRAHHAAGLCVLCSRPAVTRNHCAEHIGRVREYDRKIKLWNKVKHRQTGRVLCSACGGLGHNVRTCPDRKHDDDRPAPNYGNWQDRE